jgi:hypothetical protein
VGIARPAVAAASHGQPAVATSWQPPPLALDIAPGHTKTLLTEQVIEGKLMSVVLATSRKQDRVFKYARTAEVIFESSLIKWLPLVQPSDGRFRRFGVDGCVV